MRQKDEQEFFLFLNRIRIAVPSQEDIDLLNSHRLRIKNIVVLRKNSLHTISVCKLKFIKINTLYRKSLYRKNYFSFNLARLVIEKRKIYVC
jgi:hypothetical protein